MYAVCMRGTGNHTQQSPCRRCKGALEQGTTHVRSRRGETGACMAFVQEGIAIALVLNASCVGLRPR